MEAAVASVRYVPERSAMLTAGSVPVIDPKPPRASVPFSSWTLADRLPSGIVGRFALGSVPVMDEKPASAKVPSSNCTLDDNCASARVPVIDEKPARANVPSVR